MDMQALEREIQQLRQKVSDIEQMQRRIDEYATSSINADDITRIHSMVNHLGRALVDGFEVNNEGEQIIPRVGIAVSHGELQALLALAAEKYASIYVLFQMNNTSVGSAEYSILEQDGYAPILYVKQEQGVCVGLSHAFPLEYERG